MRSHIEKIKNSNPNSKNQKCELKSKNSKIQKSENAVFAFLYFWFLKLRVATIQNNINVADAPAYTKDEVDEISHSKIRKC